MARSFHPLADEWNDIEQRELRCGISPGQPVLMSSELIDYRLGDYFRTAYRADQNSTAQTYASELRIWFNFLGTRAVGWEDADHRDVRAFQVWRVYAPENSRPVTPATWNKGWEALNHFYRWADREGWVTSNPVREVERLKDPGRVGAHREKNSRSSRDRWLTPSEYTLWRDVGYRGYSSIRNEDGRLVPGMPNPAARARNIGRNVAFADFTLTTGLRLSEAGSLLSLEIPDTVDAEAPLIGKGGVFRYYRVMHRLGLESLRNYERGERRDAVRRGRMLGRYKDAPRAMRVVEVSDGRRGQRVKLQDGRTLDVPSLPLAARKGFVVETPSGLEPLWFWLSDSGKPLEPKAWTDVFGVGNDRVTRARSEKGVQAPWVKVTPHSLRFTFALYMLLAGVRAIDEELGFRAAHPFHYRNYSQAFDEVRDLLGHRSTSTTRNYYLEPVKGLRRSHLLRGSSLTELWDDLSANSPLIGFGGTT